MADFALFIVKVAGSVVVIAAVVALLAVGAERVIRRMWRS